MARTPRLTAVEAERLLQSKGFKVIRIKGSHKVFFKEGRRIVVPFHTGKILHPKITRQILSALE